ncbi:alpha/beta hydrolase [Kitasatospora sp. NPDC058965]|uniref:alpha/beta hydrolase n=1 Tax=Kitasatospora sp. NPDC058965 TaxID=3346682 RepID=UPI00369355CC
MTRRQIGPPGLAVPVAVAGAVLLACCAAPPQAVAPATAPASPPMPAPASPAATAPAEPACVAAGRPSPDDAVISVRGPGGVFPAVVLGRGRRTVVLSDQSDRDLCSWLPTARRLTGAGYRVVLWDYDAGYPVQELSAVVAAVRAAGAGPVALLGASKGAKTSVVAAAGLRPAVAGVAALSAEQVLSPDTAVVDYVPRLPCPLLLVTSVDDPWGSASAADAFRVAARPGTAQVVALPGAAHGVDLLSGPTADAASAAVDGFLLRVLGSA